ncbi:MAG: hypothetical protein K2Y56_16300 [Methylobacterium sp.]|uniref:CBS domain-containing protein n=1 Tax=Methylobacterium sp. TaxID=409 RepID=UPI0025D6D421|nr:hypothetical protein [Methylobacterium sp.]MBX9933073.1 hypothetical protein [Methylobacterium sp.]
MDANREFVGCAAEVQYIRMGRPVRDAMRLLATPEIGGLAVIDGARQEEAAIIGILTERDDFRALAAGGLQVLDGLVGMRAKTDFLSVDVGLDRAGRLRQFCAHGTDHLAVMDGLCLDSVQSIWDCLADTRPTA